MMCDASNILIFPAEGENAFELYRALRYAVRFTVFGAVSKGLAGHGQHIFPSYDAVLPHINDPNFIPAFAAYLTQRDIRLVFPTHDSVAAFLKAREDFLPARIMGPAADTAIICRKKSLTYAAFAGQSFCPTVFVVGTMPPAFPVFVKPDQGQGSQGCRMVENAEELRQALGSRPDQVVMEYLPGPELTVDCFTDRHGALLFVGPRSRDVVRLGMSYVTSTAHATPELSSIAAAINKRLPMRGLWFFQVKTDGKGRQKLLEIAVRASCGMGLYRQLGVNLPLLAAYDALEMDVRVLRNPGPMRASRSLETCYAPLPDFETVYVDYDDTLCLRGKVNTQLLAFLYQCLNEGKKLVLLSKHDGDLSAELRQRKICPDLFHAIIHLDAHQNKVAHIESRKAIFIDNLFSERAEIAEALGMAVYDVDAVECLLHKN